MWRASALLLVFTFACAGGQRVRGCTTPNGETSRCVSIYSCPKFVEIVNKKASPSEIQYLRSSVCEFDNNNRPIVCCGSDTDYLLPDRVDCGYQDGYRVLNGEDTDLTEFPWMALLEKTNASGFKSFGCGGSLINNRYILTAAHCFESSTVTSVRLGEWNLDADEDCIEVGDVKSCSLPPQNIGIEQIIPHKGYKRDRTGAAVNDIALIRLSAPATINSFVKPICLPLPTERSNPGERLYVSGWGATEKARYSPKKQKLLVPIVSLPKCNEKFGRYNINIGDKQICAGGEKDKDSCKGDSGGPLIAKVKGGIDQFYIEGIVSYGTICGTEGWPGIYTKVSEHIDWIKQHVKS